MGHDADEFDTRGTANRELYNRGIENPLAPPRRGEVRIAQADRVRPGTLNAPKGKTAQKPQPNRIPTWLEMAQDRWDLLFSDNPLLRRVTIKDYSALKNNLVKNFRPFGAWTQSSSEVYLRKPDVDTWGLVQEIATLHHESEHVRQFNSANTYPLTWQTMLSYEKDAYDKESKWLQTREAEDKITQATSLPYDDVSGDIDQLIDGAKDNLKDVNGIFDATKKLSGTALEEALYKLMVKKKLIPDFPNPSTKALYTQQK